MIRIDQVCEVLSSKRIFASQYVDSGIPFYRSKEIIELHNGESVSSPLYISPDTFKAIKETNGTPSQGDILITSVGTLGVPYLVKATPFYFKDGNLIWFRSFSSCCLSKYLYYWLDSNEGRNLLLSRAIGSTQKAFTIEMIKSTVLDLPTLTEQEHIIDVMPIRLQESS